MPWIQAIVDINAQQSQEIEDLLMAIGADAITLKDGANQPIYEPPLGTTPLWDQLKLVALFDAEKPLQLQMQQLKALYEQETQQTFPNYKLELVEDKDWVREWMDTFKPMPFGQRLWICPSWLEPEDKNAVNLKLDPGLAFGTGTHATTSLCLKWLDGQQLDNRSIIDFGCGSGILGIAAMLLGARDLLGIDIDPQAILASNENSERNGLNPDSYHYCLPEDAPQQQADLVLANILAGPLVELKDSILSYLKPGGDLVLSGILASQGQTVATAYDSECDILSIDEEDGWVRICAKKRV
ncbi:50S ribosomal protein L11 methyltransferase [Bermanella marisrubri]|uniref:Ribosomal protein L11 methyltransferase n=1 Tax=Bermanella marisrubri TaxID=207949 RepID=Q1N3J9_9GAMM|nr:50S ribosomal protein L11 methyltransferase [Bermanella marisrubri]EAT12875.1 ribosomal protein L11 methyltransferase [Oceanobacter sp. RED65] [Bermanella marisrubri]QIZ83195.1 50S ribosomal protein L11 methyltransferase [Bermanella marisrubri]